MITDWCYCGQHDRCRRTGQKFYVDPRSNKVVFLDEWWVCECPKRGCKCYKKKADRTPTPKKRKK